GTGDTAIRPRCSGVALPGATRDDPGPDHARTARAGAVFRLRGGSVARSARSPAARRSGDREGAVSDYWRNGGRLGGQLGEPESAVIFARSRSTSLRRRILPDADLGISSIVSTSQIFLCGATRWATYAIRASGVISLLSTPRAFGTSPASSFGLGMTAASATAG